MGWRGTAVSVACAAVVVLILAAAVRPAAPSTVDGPTLGRLPNLGSMETVDVICTGTFDGASHAVHRAIKWKTSINPVERPGARHASFRIDRVIRGDLTLSGQSIEVLYVSTLPHPFTERIPFLGGRRARRGGGIDLPDLPGVVGKRRCLLQLLRHDDGAWEIRFRGDSYLVVGARPDVAGWEALSERQRLEYELASAVLDKDPLIAAAAIESATRMWNPTAGPVLTDAMLKRQTGGPEWLSRVATCGLVSTGHLDTIYSLKSLLPKWQAEPARGRPDGIRVGMQMHLYGARGMYAVPALVELSQSPERWVRAAATEALRVTGGSDAKAALAARLEDEDPMIRHCAIFGLGNGLEPRDVGAKDWKGWLDTSNLGSPGMETMLANWSAWWQRTGKARYPTVDSVMRKAELYRRERPWALDPQLTE